MSVDPLGDKYPELTTYQFASNTPIQAIDLDGLEAFFIHGTKVPIPILGFEIRSSEWYQNDIAVARLMQLYDNTLGLTAFKWSGVNSVQSRKVAGRELAYYINSNRDVNQPVTIVGHSHGGNVAIEAANILIEEYQIAPDMINIVALNTPGSPDHTLDRAGKTHYNRLAKTSSLLVEEVHAPVRI